MNFLILNFKDGNMKYISADDILDFWIKKCKDKTNVVLVGRKNQTGSEFYDKITSWKLI